MKVYFIGQKGIPAKFGGVEKHVEELATRLVKAGHEVFVYTRPNYTDRKLKKYRWVNLISLNNLATKHLDAISHTFRACLDLTKRDADIVHFHSIGPSSLIWLAKLLKPGVPIITTFHTKCYEHKKWGAFARLCLKMGESVACRLADKVIAISVPLAEYVKLKYKIKADYIPNGVSPAKTLKAEKIKKWGLKKDSYVLTVTRLVGHKGVQYLVSAYKNLKTDKKLVIVGDGAYTDGYVKQLKELAAGNENIIFTGNQTGRELAELFSNAYVFIQPSESEGLSIALLEAMAHGKCVLVSDIIENTQVIENCGHIFKSRNSRSLKTKLLYLLSHPEIIKRYGLSAKKLVSKKYNWPKIVSLTIKLYSDQIYQRKTTGFKRFRLVQKITNLFF